MTELQRFKAAEAPPFRVLLVEDDPAEVRRTRRLLDQSDLGRFEITHATQVEEALQLLKDGSFDVMLLDLTLPEGDGLDTLARAKVAAASVPIIVMTREDDEALALNALRLGAQDYLIKGASDKRGFVRTLRLAVERHRILSELRIVRQREHYLATHDALTGLQNRFAFREVLQRAVAHAARAGTQLAVLFFDLDRFKTINDTLGHPVGDELLNAVADRLRSATRRSDLVTRIGGDEFIVLLQDVGRDFAPAKAAQNILEELGKPYSLGGREYWLTASIGIAVCPRDGTDPDILIRNADAAMYSAKNAGRNRFHYYAEHMNQVAAARLDLEGALREAIERNQFVLDFQPQVDVGRRRIVGAEALVRWRHPERGLIAPAEFIPIAEETGLISSLGEWVLRSACETAARWQSSRGKSVRIAVNVSARQLSQKGFSDTVIRVLRETGLEPSRLELEITESSMLQERALTVATLLVLRRLGVQVSVDDFGTGYASIALLKTLPIDALKIDRSFVSGMTSDLADASIVGGLIKIASGLGIQVIAEGVERRDQMNLLHAMGCGVMQGYLFGKPVPDSEFKAMLHASTTRWRRSDEKPDEDGD